MAVIAGPNGSGKTTFYDRFLKEAFPVFVNADRIAENIANLSTDVSSDVSNIEAAGMAEDERRRLIAAGSSFAMETVFSRTAHWLDFLENAKAQGYSVWLFVVCLETPELNIARVISRVRRGGHPVAPEKVQTRWQKSLDTAVLSIPVADDLWLYDNSVPNRQHRLIGAFSAGKPVFRVVDIPLWAKPFFGPDLLVA
jgi:predicted ABC-type ATPase